MLRVCGFGRGSGDNAFSHGVEDKVGNTIQFQLLKNMNAVRFHGMQAQIQMIRHLLIGLAFGDELKDFPFTSGRLPMILTPPIRRRCTYLSKSQVT